MPFTAMPGEYTEPDLMPPVTIGAITMSQVAGLNAAIAPLNAHLARTDNPHSNLITRKRHKVQQYMIITDHNYLGYAVIVNKKFWDGLPADIRAKLEVAMAEATKHANAVAKKENDEAMDDVKKSGKTAIYVPNDKEKAEWRKALLPVHVEMADRIGKDLIEAATAAANAPEPAPAAPAKKK